MFLHQFHNRIFKWYRHQILCSKNSQNREKMLLKLQKSLNMRKKMRRRDFVFFSWYSEMFFQLSQRQTEYPSKIMQTTFEPLLLSKTVVKRKKKKMYVSRISSKKVLTLFFLVFQKSGFKLSYERKTFKNSTRDVYTNFAWKKYCLLFTPRSALQYLRFGKSLFWST